MVIFHSFLYVYQAGYPRFFPHRMACFPGIQQGLDQSQPLGPSVSPSRRLAKGCRIPRAVLGSVEPAITYHIYMYILCIYVYIMYICIYMYIYIYYAYIHINIYLICILYTRCFSSTLHVANEHPSNSL